MSGIVYTEGVWKIYGSKGAHLVEAVNDASVEIEEGKVTAFGGPSGSGKSTLLALIGLLTKPTRGKVFIDNEELSALSEVYRTRIRREKIGFIFQANYLIPQLTAVENVALPKVCTDTARSDAEKAAEEKLIALDMGNRLDFRVAELSGGEQQRVSIARSLMNSPKILIADEPSSSIDEKLTDELLASLRKMADDEGLTVIVATHDQRVLNWADHLYTMSEGTIV
ncbi:MAG: ABC transporter ATP-binding protein [Candidatus Thorarchaeota archaeon]|nr:ABC transporter ATP-binding protein [Candidatus Thorarchaeota archaeon]